MSKVDENLIEARKVLSKMIIGYGEAICAGTAYQEYVEAIRVGIEHGRMLERERSNSGVATPLACALCGKRLSRKTARQINGVVMCSNCMFLPPAPVDRNPKGGDSEAAPSRSDESAVTAQPAGAQSPELSTASHGIEIQEKAA